MNGQAAVKICGIRNSQTLQAMLDLPVDYVGFVFAPSKRQVSPEEAGEMLRFLHNSGVSDGRFQSVGVFVNPEWDMLAATIARAPLDVVQLHGQETPEVCRSVKETFGTQVWRSLSAVSATKQALAGLDAYLGSIDALLLDTAGGGTGQTFDWQAIPAYQEWCKANGVKLFVAGGLQPDNVAGLLEAYKPDGVDVSSGVETDGVKDPDKIKRFVERVKGR